VPELLDLFVAEAFAGLQEARAALASGDRTTALLVSHRLRGGSATLGAPRFAQLWAWLEQTIKTHGLDATGPILAALEQEFEQVRQTLDLICRPSK
jgi:HPt (histidine-containing phosphotransfer) domain-containing protein